MAIKLQKRGSFFAFAPIFFVIAPKWSIFEQQNIQFMKRFFTLSLLLAAVACTNTDDDKKSVTLDFEGNGWNALSATTAGTEYSSDFVAGGYEWMDAESGLKSEALIDDSYGYTYIRSGMLVSSYNSAAYATYGDYTKDLYVYNPDSKSTTSGGGHKGSDNYLIVVGNYDETSNGDERAEMYFADGKARKVLGCYVNYTTYFLNIAKNGNPYSPALVEGDAPIKLTATGYNDIGVETGSTEMTFARWDRFIEDWTAWDLSALGEVVSIKFNITGGPATEWGMTTPKYFAIDDITIEWNE